MALTKMTDDLDIVAQLDDEPNDVGGLSPAEFKAKFDEGPNAVKDFINDTLTEELDPYLHLHSNKTALDSVPSGGVVTTLGGDDTTVPTSKAVSDAISLTGNLPSGGFTHQVLAKASEDAYDTEWETPAAENLSYDNTDSGLMAENVQDAIDEALDTFYNKQDVITVNGIVKGNGSGGLSSASAGTDYYAPSSTDVAVADGGTGASTAADGLYNLISALSSVTIADADKIPVLDADGSTVGYVTRSSLLSGLARISTGSYAGSGQFSSAHPNTISLSFAPKMVLLFKTGYTSGRGSGDVYWSTSFAILTYPITSINVASASVPSMTSIVLSWGDTSVSWYSVDAEYQFNTSGTTYYYIAIG